MFSILDTRPELAGSRASRSAWPAGCHGGRAMQPPPPLLAAGCCVGATFQVGKLFAPSFSFVEQWVQLISGLGPLIDAAGGASSTLHRLLAWAAAARREERHARIATFARSAYLGAGGLEAHRLAELPSPPSSQSLPLAGYLQPGEPSSSSERLVCLKNDNFSLSAQPLARSVSSHL